ncbi:hypothetical protein EKH55_5500 [Sinorhizobium alkalisoli]|nr:hypothetical protein EKH55_5500 [Sinorhizobium alkalisoli]
MTGRQRRFASGKKRRSRPCAENGGCSLPGRQAPGKRAGNRRRIGTPHAQNRATASRRRDERYSWDRHRRMRRNPCMRRVSRSLRPGDRCAPLWSLSREARRVWRCCSRLPRPPQCPVGGPGGPKTSCSIHTIKP